MMLLGLSVSRCIRDIVLDKVDITDVYLIIGRTLVEEEEHFEELWRGYSGSKFYPWFGLDYDKTKEVFLTLYRDQRIVQPRLEGMWFGSADNHWYEMNPYSIRPE